LPFFALGEGGRSNFLWRLTLTTLASCNSYHIVVGTLVAALFMAGLPTGPAHAQSYGTESGTCDRTSLSHTFDTSTNNLLGTALGAAAGGLLGSQFGKGGGKSATTVIGVLGGALAGGMVGRSMAPVDHACINKSLEHGKTGQTVAWQNPDNGTRYEVTPTRTYQGENGLPCREYETTAYIDGKAEQIHGSACRQADGSWKQQQ
jgi:surface antigen